MVAASMATSSTLSVAASSRLQLGAAQSFSVPRVLAPAPLLKCRSLGVGVVNCMSSPQGANWLIGQCSAFQRLQSGLLAGTSTTPYNCQSDLGVASISKIFSGFGEGGGKGFGGWGRGGGGWGRGGGGGGGGGGGDGSGVPAAGEGSIGAPDGEASNPITEDVIFLSVGGMSCGGCSASVKRILEAQPQVKEATVDLATETAIVQITTEPVATSGWEVVKRQLGESLAKHLTTCGFKSSVKDDGEKAEPAA